MPRYFFDTETNELVHHDNVGMECASDDAPRQEALRTMGELARDSVAISRAEHSILMTVRNEQDIAFFEVALTVATRSLR